MNIGIPKERRAFEYRVGMTPVGVKMLCRQGHTLYVEHEAGVGSGFSDLDYEQAGARIAYSPHEVFGRSDLLLKVARPMYEEIEWMQPGSTIAGLLHMASSRHDKIELLFDKNITSVAYEQIQLSDGSVPVRKPLSQIGGRLAGQIGARLLQNNAGGKGILLGGIGGIPPAEVVVIGAGIAGRAAVEVLLGLGAHVNVLDTDPEALQRLVDRFCGIATTLSYDVSIARALTYADLVLAAVLVPDERPPVVITREMVRAMKPRSVLMDLSIDEGGCVETSRPTTHEHPTYIEEGIIHYCVPNIPSVVARTSTYAFLNAAYAFIEQIAGKGVEKAVAENPALAHAVYTHHGELFPHPKGMD